MAVELRVRAGADSAMIIWRGPFIAGCRGFALHRRILRAPGSTPSPHTVAEIPTSDAAGAARRGKAAPAGSVEEVVASWVGFADGPDEPAGTRRPTTEWPIQKYLWSDFMVGPGDQVAYRVTPMGGKAGALAPIDSQAAGWSETVTIGAGTEGGASAHFNRGIVASQWLARLLPDVQPEKKLAASIATPGDTIREFLAGPLRIRLLELLGKAASAKGHVYAALFELDDPELLALLAGFGKRAHVVLGNGAVAKAGQDENAQARKALAGCDVKDRMTAPARLAHNKFLVLCDAARQPKAVWTGSTNWTKSGLCTQANNAVLVRNAALASLYLDQWQALARAGSDTPPALRAANGTPRSAGPRKAITLWFTPMDHQADLDQAGEMIAAARQGIMFLFFNPGPRGTLLNDIIELASPGSAKFNPDLYIHGVINQNPGTAQNPVTLFNRGDRIDANADVVIPAAISQPLKFWHKELLKLPTAHAMVHSKVVLVDPFGARPVVMTGSHNMGPRASGTNDENLLIIRDNASLAGQYACNIMEIYSQYRWRASQAKTNGKPQWSGLADDDAWQIRDPGQGWDKRRLRELDFWFGTR
jgi:phosphatidylserine/phosphatidylglycerophosphate/cardiolipin synthase-like enzyme